MKINWNLEAYFPVGMPWQQDSKLILFGYVASSVWSLYCPVQIYQSYQDLFDSGKLIPEVMMADFIQLADNAFLGFGALILAMILLAIANYRSHFKGSKSVYLMRRLPQKYEMLKRCLSVPAAVILLTLATAFLLLMTYYWIYCAVTPKQCLAPGQWQKLMGGIFL